MIGIGLIFLAGAICLGYYLICGLSAGFGISLLWLWLAVGLGCIGSAGAVFALHRAAPEAQWPAAALWGIRIAAGAVMIAFLTVEGMVISSMDDTGEPGLSCIIVLGAGVNGTEPSLALESRIGRAAEYLKENPKTFAVVSGGQGNGENISEAECMARELMERGIAEERIRMEDQSTTTEENLRFSRTVLEEEAESLESMKIGVVTSNFHLYRAKRLAERELGVPVCGISAKFTSLRLPHYMMREFCCLAADFVKNGGV